MCRFVERGVGVSPAVIPRDVGVRFGVVGRLVRADGAVDQQLQQVGPQHVPVVIVVLLTLVAAHHESANSLVRQQGLVNRQVGQVGLDRHSLLLIQGLSRLDGVQRRRRVAGVVGERVGRQTRREVVAHASSLRKRAVITPAGRSRAGSVAFGPAARPSKRVSMVDRADRMGFSLRMRMEGFTDVPWHVPPRRQLRPGRQSVRARSADWPMTRCRPGATTRTRWRCWG